MPAPCGRRVCPRSFAGSLTGSRLNIQSICHRGAARGGLRALSFVVAGLGFLGYRWLSGGERIDRQATLTTIARA